MTTSTCPHGMNPAGCSFCRSTAPAVPAAPAGRSAAPPSRQRLLDEVCAVLGVARHVETPGSSPSRVFEAAARSAEVPARSMPEIGAAIAAKAGLEWAPDCDNRGHNRIATSVTAQGIATMRTALLSLGVSVRAGTPVTSRS